MKLIVIICILLRHIIQTYSIILVLKNDRKQHLFLEEIRKSTLYGRYFAIVSKMPSINSILQTLCDKLINKFDNKPRILIMLITFTIIPRFIVAICLSIDVLYYGHMKLMYMAVVLLIIPRMFNVIIGMIKHEAELNLLKLDKKVDIGMAKRRYKYNEESKYSTIIRVTTTIQIVKISKAMLYMRIITIVLYIFAWTLYILN
jgi:hypothetical protein